MLILPCCHHSYAPEDIPYGKERYVTETKRLYRVLDMRLKDHEWLVGDKYSIADLNAYPWLQLYRWAGLKDEDVPQSVKDYIERNYARPAVKRGMVSKPALKPVRMFCMVSDDVRTAGARRIERVPRQDSQP